jgi:type I restriction enzyme M protein
LLKPGGRAAVIVPDGVLFGSSKAHKALRKLLVEDHKLDGIVSMPSGVFRPYAGVSTAILLFTKTNSGGTDQVWFYDMKADGYSLDDKRNALDASKHETNNLPDILTRWKSLSLPSSSGKSAGREGVAERSAVYSVGEHTRARTDQSFLVPKSEIAGNDYDLSINRYKQVVYEEVKHESPKVILAQLKTLEAEILKGMEELEGMLS